MTQTASPAFGGENKGTYEQFILPLLLPRSIQNPINFRSLEKSAFGEHAAKEVGFRNVDLVWGCPEFLEESEPDGLEGWGGEGGLYVAEGSHWLVGVVSGRMLTGILRGILRE